MAHLATRVLEAFSLVDELLDTWMGGGLYRALKWKFEHWGLNNPAFKKF